MGLCTLAVLICAVAWAVMFDARQTAAEDFSAMAVSNKTDLVVPAVTTSTSQTPPDLPIFSSSTVTSDFHTIAADVKLPVDEVRYTLDSSASQPSTA